MHAVRGSLQQVQVCVKSGLDSGCVPAQADDWEG